MSFATTLSGTNKTLYTQNSLLIYTINEKIHIFHDLGKLTQCEYKYMVTWHFQTGLECIMSEQHKNGQ